MPQKKSTNARPATRTPRKSATAASQPPQEMIARRAYEIWQAAVHRVNQKAQHWTEAESQLRAEMKKSARARRPASQTKTATEAQPQRKADTRLAA